MEKKKPTRILDFLGKLVITSEMKCLAHLEASSRVKWSCKNERIKLFA